MTSQTPDLATVVERLEKVERQNRRLRLIGVAILVLAVGGLLMGQALPRQRTVIAEEFILKDANGKGRASLGTVGDRVVSLILSDPSGDNVVSLSVDDGAPSVTVRQTGKSGKSYASLSLDDGAPRVTVRQMGKSGKSYASLSLDDERHA